MTSLKAAASREPEKDPSKSRGQVNPHSIHLLLCFIQLSHVVAAVGRYYVAPTIICMSG